MRDMLGNDVPGITDKDIQEALWHYYYDVDKSVNYLLQKSMPKEEKKKKTKGGSLFLPVTRDAHAVTRTGVCCTRPEKERWSLRRCVTSSDGAIQYCG